MQSTASPLAVPASSAYKNCPRVVDPNSLSLLELDPRGKSLIIKLFKARSGPALKKQLDSDPH